jgi:hypothetical protein
MSPRPGDDPYQLIGLDLPAVDVGIGAAPKRLGAHLAVAEAPPDVIADLSTVRHSLLDIGHGVLPSIRVSCACDAVTRVVDGQRQELRPEP